MPSLRELQQGFVAAILAGDGAPPPFATVPAESGQECIAIYRRGVFANYRGALGASYPVVTKLVGAPFFHAAVDAFVLAHPSVSGDLNTYGSEFGAFLESYAPAADLPYLPDVARLEWAVDEAGNAADSDASPDAVLAAFSAVAPERLPALQLALAPTCRLVASKYPVLRIWQLNQVGAPDDARVSLDEGGVAVHVRRDAGGVSLTRIGAGEHAWLAALAAGKTLGAAIDAAQDADATFDLGSALRERIADATIAGIVEGT
jgi:hypothetical protein